jgi:hypothetical protein
MTSSDSNCEWDSDTGKNVMKKEKADAVKYVKLRESPLTVAVLSPIPAYFFTENYMEKDRFWVGTCLDGSKSYQTDCFSSEKRENTSIIDHAILINDLELLRFLLDMVKDLTDRDHRHRKLENVLNPSYLFALGLGRIDSLALMIKKAGTGLFEQKSIYCRDTNASDSMLILLEKYDPKKTN